MNILFFLYVSGVVLANASLDIAFHDKWVICFSILAVSISSFYFKRSLLSFKDLYYNCPSLLLYIMHLRTIGHFNSEWLRTVIYAYITGILDAKEKGLYVNYNKKKKRLEFSIKISLTYYWATKEEKKGKCKNERFVGVIKEFLGGDTKVYIAKNEVIWYLSSLNDTDCKIIDEILDFWEKIPFFSLKMRQNFNFFVKCYKDKENIKQYLDNVQDIYKKFIPYKDYKFNNIQSNETPRHQMVYNGYKSLITLDYKSAGDHLFLFWLQGYLKINGTLKVIYSVNNKTEFRITSKDKNIIRYIVNQFFFDENSVKYKEKLDKKRKYNQKIETYTLIINKEKELQRLCKFYLRSNYTNPCLEYIEKFI